MILINNNLAVWQSYMRINVTVDDWKSLKRFKRIRKQGGAWSVVNFKYEKLHFFFVFGLLGHTNRFCEKRFDAPDGDISKDWVLGYELQLKEVFF